MTIKLQKPDITELKPRITVFGVGGGGGNAVNNMITLASKASSSSSPTPMPRRSP
jgi:cell division GTPase FtsZ